MPKKKKPIQPTASLATITKMLEKRKKGESTTPPVYYEKREQPFKLPEQVLHYHEVNEQKKKANAAAISERRATLLATPAKMEDTYNGILECYRKTQNCEVAMQQYADALSHLSTIYTNPPRSTYSVRALVLCKLCNEDVKFLAYMSDDEIYFLVKNGDTFNLDNPQLTSAIYHRLGERLLDCRRNTLKFPQLISKMNCDQSVGVLKYHPELYGELSKAVHDEILSKKDNAGKHTLLIQIIRNNQAVVKYLPDNDFLKAFLDYSSQMINLIKAQPEQLLRLPSTIFIAIKPSTAFQYVNKGEFVNNIIELDRQNNTNLYEQITYHHKPLGDYFANFIEKPTTTSI